MPIYAECFECGGDIEIAMWDDSILSGLLKPVCMECKEDVPEFCLWETPHPEDDHFDFIVDEMPATLDDGEDWLVRDRYADWEEEYADEDGTIPEWILNDPPTMGEKFDIIFRDASDEAMVTEAREEVQRRLEA